MALFKKENPLDKMAIEEIEKYLEERKKSAEVEEDVEETEVEETDEEVETTEEPESEETEAEEVETEEYTEDTEEKAEEEEKDDDILMALEAKLEAGLEEIRVYKEKIESIIERLEKIDTPTESVGLEKAKTFSDEPNEEDLSASDYAKKYARY